MDVAVNMITKPRLISNLVSTRSQSTFGDMAKPSTYTATPRRILPLLLAFVSARRGGATKPALGWSSWNFFGSDATEDKVLAIARKLVSTGLADLGFRYVNIDAGAYYTSRDQTTMKIVPDARKFPSGLRALSDALHAMGLKFGTYTHAR